MRDWATRLLVGSIATTLLIAAPIARAQDSNSSAPVQVAPPSPATTTPVIPGDFQLQGRTIVQQPEPQPQATPPVEVAPPPAAAPTPVPGPAETPARPQSEAPGPTPSSSTPDAAPSPAAPTTLPTEPMPLDTTPTAPNAPAPSPQALRPWPWYYYAAPAGLLLALLAFALLRRRREEEEIFEEAAPAIEDPAIDAPPVEAPVVEAPALAALPPAPMPDPSLRPWLEIELKAERAQATDSETMVLFELEIRNSGNAPANNLRIDVKMFNAGKEQDQEIGAFFRTAGRESTKCHLPGIPAGMTGVLHGEVAMPREEMRAVVLDNKYLFIPMLAVNALYDWDEGRTGQTSKSYVVGRELEQQGEKMGAFRVDLGPRIWRTIGQRQHTLARRV